MKTIDSIVIYVGRFVAIPIANRITSQMLLISRHSGWTACLPIVAYLASLSTFVFVFWIPMIWAICRNLDLDEDRYDNRLDEEDLNLNWRSEGF